MSAESYFIHNLDPFIVRFPESFPLEGIRWYGVAYVMGFIAAAGLLAWYHRKERSSLDADSRASLMTTVIIGALLGGRLGYMLLYDFGSFLSDPLTLLRVWEGGMASHGGFVGVALALLWFSYKTKMPLLQLSDMAVTLAPPGLFFGRLANYINDELWGKVSDVSHAIIFPHAQLAPYFDPLKFTVFSQQLEQWVNPRHPSQLYQAALEGLLLFVLAQWRFWKFPKLSKGQLTGEFLVAYAVLRIIGEVYREPDAELILGLSRGSFYSLFMIVCGLGLVVFARKRSTALTGN